MDFDGAAALRCWPVDIDLAGRSHRIPPTPAAGWVMVVLDAAADVGSDYRWTDVVPGLVDADDGDLVDRLDSGEVTVSEMASAAKDAVTAASGMPWWAALRLAVTSVGSADVAGALALALDPGRVSFGAWCAATYRILVEGADDKQRAKIDAEITSPPESVTAEELYDEDAASDAFERLMARRG